MPVCRRLPRGGSWGHNLACEPRLPVARHPSAAVLLAVAFIGGTAAILLIKVMIAVVVVLGIVITVGDVAIDPRGRWGEDSPHLPWRYWATVVATSAASVAVSSGPSFLCTTRTVAMCRCRRQFPDIQQLLSHLLAALYLLTVN